MAFNFGMNQTRGLRPGRQPGIGARLLRSTLLFIVLMTAAGVAAVMYQTREVKAWQYRAIHEAFIVVAPDLQAHMAGFMSDGKVTQWEWNAINRVIPLPGMETSGGADLTSERASLAALSRQVGQINED